MKSCSIPIESNPDEYLDGWQANAINLPLWDGWNPTPFMMILRRMPDGFRFTTLIKLNPLNIKLPVFWEFPTHCCDLPGCSSVLHLETPRKRYLETRQLPGSIEEARCFKALFGAKSYI